MQKWYKFLVYIFFTTLLSTINFYSQNLITNGDFGAFNATIPSPPPLGYSTTYTQVPYNDASLIATGKYQITNNPSRNSPLRLKNTFDISNGVIGDGTGNMMFVRGQGNQIFWQLNQPTLTLTPGQTYLFSFWCMNVHLNTNGANPNAKIRLNIPGVTTTLKQYDIYNTEFVKYSYSFVAPATPVSIQLSTIGAGSLGNYFVIDDISLTPPIVPMTISFAKTNPSCSAPADNDGSIVVYTNSGVLPYTFNLTGSTTLMNNTGVFTGLGPGTYVVTVKDSDPNPLAPPPLSTTSISLAAPPVFTLVSSAASCVSPGSPVTLTATGGTAYDWSASSAVPIVNSGNRVSVTPAINTTYTVTSSRTIPNTNLITNGGFESPSNSEFYSDFVYTTQATDLNQPDYGIVTSPNSWNSTFITSTARTGTKMFVAKGATVPNKTIWSQTVLVDKSKTYTFEFYAQNSSSVSPATFRVLINGVQIISPISASNAGTPVWTKIMGTWSSSATTTTAKIQIINTNISLAGNDFAIDDISFTTAAPAKSCNLTKTVDVKVSLQSNFVAIPVFCSGTPDYLLATTSPNGIVGTWLPATVSNTANGSYVFAPNSAIDACAVGQTLNAIVISNNSIVLSSAVGTNAQTKCINTAITTITYTTTGATGAIFIGLPTGVTGSWSANTVTISGTPWVSGTFDYSIKLTGGCGTVSATGLISVNNNNTVGVASSTPTLCINNAMTSITHTTSGATGIGVATGLPAGVSATWASNTITINGTPTASGTFNYSIPMTGGCGSVNATGTITVTPANTAGSPSSTPTLCINAALTNITITTTGTTGISDSGVSGANGLPAGVTARFAANTITISGTPTVSGTFNYRIPLTDGCSSVNATGTITVIRNNTIQLSSAVNTDTQTVCIFFTPITNITYTTTGATGATFSGLPAGVTGSWSANTVTISGKPTVSGTFNYTVTTSGGCSTTSTGTITVSKDDTIALTSLVGTNIQTKCINTLITDIVYTTTGATGASITSGALPSGVSGNFLAGVYTISGKPTVSGTFNYTVTTSGGCAAAVSTGTITVSKDDTIALTSLVGTNIQTKCINTPITNITYITTGATAATFSGLPTGVTGSWSANTVTISGTPSVSVGSPYNYTVTLTGGCGNVSATGTIKVNPNNTIALSSSIGTVEQTVCINTPIANVRHSTTGATGATFSGLPTGVTGSWSANTVTISGTPTVSVGSPYNYTVFLIGGCGTVNTTVSITVAPNNKAVLSSAIGTDGQTVCFSTPITNITYTTTGATGATFSGLPTGVTGSWSANTVTISGTPTVSVGSPYNYTVSLNGGCPVTVNGSITLNSDSTSSATGILIGGNVNGATTVCTGTNSTALTLSGAPRTIVRWESSLDNFATAGTAIANTTSIFIATNLNVTTYYRAVQSGVCATSNSASAKIDVTPLSVGGSVNGATTVCTGTNSSTLTLTGNTGTVVRWESSLDNFATAGTVITNTTSTYTATNLTANTSYRAVVQSGVCPTTNSAVANITVSALSVGGSVNGTTTVCTGTNSTVLSLSGHTGTIVRWESSLNNFATAGTAIANTTSIFIASNLNSTTYYRAVVQSGVCATANSVVAAVTVSLLSVGGTVNGATTVCTGTNSTILTLTGNTGTIVRWESSLDNFATAGTAIANTKTTYTATNLTKTTSYRAVVQSGVCATANSVVATVPVSPQLASSISAGGTIASSITINNGSSIQLQLNGFLNAEPNIQWTPATAISATSVSNPIVYPNTTTTYTASFINTNGCLQSTSIVVNVNAQPNIGNLSLTSPSTTPIGFFDTVTVNVQLSEATDLYGLYMKVKGNAAVSQYLDYQGFTASTLLGSGSNVISTPPTVTNGVFDFGITKVGPSSGYSGSGLYYTLSFTPKNISIPDGTVFCFSIDNISAYNSSGISCSLTNQGQYCYTFTNKVNVWPGDLNKSKTVTTADILPIGYFYNSTGPARPNATIQWTAQPIIPWGYNRSTQNGDAYKVFADSNGDGVITNADQAAIGFNMTKVHSKSANIKPFAISPKVEQTTLAGGALVVTSNTNVINTTNLPQTVTFTVNLNNTGGLDALYGISVNLIFDDTIFDLSTASIDYTGTIFGKTGSDCLILNYNSATGVSVGLTRYANAAINGQGLLFKVTLSTKLPVVSSLSETQVTAYADTANNQAGDILVVQDAPVTTIVIKNNLSVDNNTADEFVLYPNPVNDILYLSTGKSTDQLENLKLIVFNTLGQIVNEIPIKNSNMKISTRNWGASGVYFVKIVDDANYIMSVRKIILR